MSASDAEAAGIELDLSSLTGDEIEGGYRSLCGAMLLRAAQELGIKKQYRKMAIRARKTSRAWLFQDAGIIQFAEACEACGMDRQRLLNQMVEYSDRLIANPRSSGSVFGREIGPSTPA